MSEAASSRQIRVVVGDPCPIIAVGMGRIFEMDQRIQLVGEAANLSQLRKKIVEERANLALIDQSLVVWHLKESLDELIEIGKHCSFLLLSQFNDSREQKRVLQLGGRGVLNKNSSPQQIRRALWKVFEGGIFIERNVAETLLDHTLSPKSEADREHVRVGLLTPREREVVGLICKGLRNKEIASQLLISETTVWHHLSSIFSKLQVSDRLGLLSFAYKHSHHFVTLLDMKPQGRKVESEYSNNTQKRMRSGAKTNRPESVVNPSVAPAENIQQLTS